MMILGLHCRGKRGILLIRLCMGEGGMRLAFRSVFPYKEGVSIGMMG
jgi:hypothetical protein